MTKSGPDVPIPGANTGHIGLSDIFTSAAVPQEEAKAPVKQISMAQTDNRNEMTEIQKKELLQNVFDKLEKHARISKLERALKLDESHLHAWLEAWEGPQQEQNVMVAPSDLMTAMSFQHSANGGYTM